MSMFSKSMCKKSQGKTKGDGRARMKRYGSFHSIEKIRKLVMLILSKLRDRHRK